MERRKEKSRDAARCRRGRETEIFTDLSSLLPIPASKVAHLDKASVIRLAISLLKIRAVVDSLPTKEEKETKIEGCSMDSLFVDSLEGFLLVTTAEGDIVYISESVNRYLGLQQVEVLGQSIYELSHPCDHAEIKEMLSTKDVNVQKSYFLRMKWSPKGRSVNCNKATQYKVIHYTGRVMPTKPPQVDQDANNNAATSEDGDSNSIVANTPAYHFIGIGEAIWHPANIEIPLGINTFLSKHSLDMKYTYADESIEVKIISALGKCSKKTDLRVRLSVNAFYSVHSLDMKFAEVDNRIVEFFGYNPDALIKKSIYDYHHAQDTAVIKNCFKNLFEKGQSQTERYRFLALGGGYKWVVTQVTLIYSNNQKPLSVVCVNFIVSEIENKNEIYSLCQLDNSCTPLTPVDSPPRSLTAATAAADTTSTSTTTAAASSSAAAAAAETYLYENSPQRLIEKLRINPSPSPSPYSSSSNNKITVNATKNRYSTVAPATNTQQQQRTAAASTGAIKNKKQSSGCVVKQQQQQQQRKVDAEPLTSSVPLGIEELLLASSSSSSGSSCSDSDTSASPPCATLDEYWLMNEDRRKDSVSFYGLSSSGSSISSENDHLSSSPPSSSEAEQSIKIENIQSNESSAAPSSPSDDSSVVVVKVSDIPKPATVNVFVPFTEEMNKGFLGLDDTGLTMLKEDPEDLTHLAPTAGDVCVPLDDNPIDYVLPDMLDDIMFSDCRLLSSDTDRDLSSSSPNSFFSYTRDDLEPSSRPLSPILTPQNEDCSIPSFCSDDSSLHDNSVTHFLDFSLINPTDDIDDLSGKSPYIPLSLDQDPLLPFVTNDFMWGSSSGESSTWSSEPSSPTSNCSLSPRLDHTTSSLAKLLKAKPICNYDGGGDRDNEHRGSNGNANHANAAGGAATKHANNFGNNVNSLADRNYSSIGHFKTVAYHRNVNVITEMKRRTNNTAKKDTCNNRSTDDKRAKNAHIAAGSKRTVSENSWGRGANSCKRSKQTSRTIIVNGAAGGGGAGNGNANSNTAGNRRIQQESAAMAEAVAKQTNSVLMNLLVSGCDLNAGYDEDFKDTNTRRSVDDGGGVVRYSNPAHQQHQHQHQSNTNSNNYQAKNNIGNGNGSLDSKCWSPFKKKSANLFDSESSQIPSLMDLTEQDYAVNAPSAGELLQGCDLLKALECTSII
ncbi:hypoxia-inducible factor 1-alpha-like isoform X2 [Planococcus citri]